MRVIPVIDLRGGRAVLARGGDRGEYRPVESLLYQGDDPLGLALEYREVLGLDEIYLADLDAIAGGTPALELLRRASEAGLKVWVDAGLREPSRAGALFDAGAQTVIAATETLAGPAALAEIVRESPPGTVVFGLDLRAGQPVVAPGSSWHSIEPHGLVETGLALGLRRLLILDMGRVGSGSGVGGLELAGRVAGARPDVELIVGGGVAGRADLTVLEALGVSAVLVGSALHDGRLTRDDVSPVPGREGRRSETG
jgi:phosphoribosylformimino-5-aminoimidazole carboxamide ribotide isomerase